MAMMDYYKILEVDQDATAAMIKKSYRVLAKKYHPDLNPENEEAARKFVQINEAYNILSDETSRAKYDRQRNEPQKESEQGQHDDKETQYKYSREESVKVDFENWDTQFEDFFGFDPRSKEVDPEKMRKKTSENKVSREFEDFFGFRPKKK